MDYKKLLKDLKESFIKKDIVVVERESERERGERERGEAHRDTERGDSIGREGESV